MSNTLVDLGRDVCVTLDMDAELDVDVASNDNRDDDRRVI